MAEDLINEIDPEETPRIEGQTEGGSEPETSEDVKTGVASASGADVAGVVSTGLEGEGVSESSEPTGTEGGAEDVVPSGAEDTEAGIDDSPTDAAIEASRQSVKRWCLRLHKKVIAGLVLARQHKKIIGGLVLGLCMSLLVAYGLKHWQMDQGGKREKVSSTWIYRAPVMRHWNAILDLAAFVVLLPEDENRAYFSLSISVKLSKSSVCREIKERKTFFRGVIYGVLNKAVKASSPQVISKEQLKQDIISALNGLLVTGTIDDIYFTDFLVV
ncbi:MAG: flagellar basal body-associated FliL family protein [Desulfobacterales bacterium]|nr:flagellar basal body-associated FliL family protein [Desulfobacterales bacterium]